MNRLLIKGCLSGLFVGALLSQRVQAQTGPVNITTTAVPFLRINPDARSGGMGDVGLATAPDAGSSLVNLAKTPFATEKNGISAAYTPWMKDIADNVYLASLAGYHRLDDQQAIGASLRYFNLGNIAISDYSGNKLSTATPREFAFDLGYSRKLSKVFSLALALRYINSSLASGTVNGERYKAGQAVAADISLYYRKLDEKGQGFSAGLVASNLGSQIGYTDNANTKDFIPANLGLGIGYTAVLEEVNSLTFSAQLDKLLVPSAPADAAGLADYYSLPIVKSWTKSFNGGVYQVGIGGEYTYDKLFSLRAGYHIGDKNQGYPSYFTAGVGLQLNKTNFNFSYLAPSGSGTTRNPLSNTLRFGVNFAL